MDFANFDEKSFSPEQTTMNRLLRLFGLLLVATFILPVDRRGSLLISVWDQLGSVSVIDSIRLVLPAVVGCVFVWLGFFAKLEVKLKAAIAAGALGMLVLVGVNPFEIFRVVMPPISGNAATLDVIEYRTGVRLDLTPGRFFPREDTLHLVLLGLGLVTLGVGGRYRDKLQSSRLGAYILMAASVLILAYYVAPYSKGKVAASANITLYKGFYKVSGKLVREAKRMEERVDDVWGQTMDRQAAEERKRIDAKIKEGKMAGQLKISAVYFLVIYFVPALLALLGILSWKPSEHKNHRVIAGRLVGWGAGIYLLAFLFPLVMKEAMMETGPGFWPNLRAFIILAAMLMGLTITVALVVRHYVEGGKNDDGLSADPLAWDEEDAGVSAAGTDWDHDDLS